MYKSIFKISTLLVAFMFFFATTKANTFSEESKLKEVYNQYFNLKNALVKTDAVGAAKEAATLIVVLNAVEKTSLTTEETALWDKLFTSLKEDAEHISESKDIAHQRNHFMSLSKNMYAVIKVSKSDTSTYYQYCPMANDGKGAHWLSKEKAVKNPYYGSRMMSCGRVLETIN